MDHGESKDLKADALEARLLAALRRSSADARPTPDCPDPADIATLLTGDGEAMAAFLSHAASCDHCGPLVDAAVSGMPNQDDDRALLEELASNRPEWRKQMAFRLAGDGKKATPSRSWLWTGGALAASALVALGLWQWQRGAANPQSLLAQAYTESRPFEFRLPNNGHSPVRQQRGTWSTFDRPLALSRAEAEIQRRLQAAPSDPQLLAAKAQAELLELQYEAAIQSLEQAREFVPNDPLILELLACAFAVRAQSESKPVDYGRSIDLLQRVLKENERSPGALFNLAVILERMSLLQQAADAWGKLIALETSGPWSDEARNKLKQIEATLDKKVRLEVEPAAAALISRIRSGDHVDAEPYLDAFWTSWLPAYRSDTLSKTAADLLAAISVKQFADQSLLDATRAASDDGASVLASLIVANARGQADDAATAGASLFTRRHTAARPLALRAGVEVTYALDRSQQLTQCVDFSTKVLDELRSTTYLWMKGQVTIQLASCQASLGSVGSAQESIRAAVQLTEQAGYRLLSLRARGIATTFDRLAEDHAAVWTAATQGLGLYWQTAAPATRLHQFTGDLSQSAVSLGLRSTAAVFGRATLAAAVKTQSPVAIALTRVIAAGLLDQDGQAAAAAQELEQADREFAQLPPSATLDAHRLAARIDRARIHASSGATGTSGLLSAIDGDISGASRVLQRNYHSARGQLLQRSGTPTEAAAAIERAIDLHEQHVKSLATRTERLTAAAAGANLFRTLIDLRFEEAAATQSLETWERFRSSLGEYHPLESLESAFRDCDCAAIVFMVLPDDVVAWVVDKRGVEGRRLGVQSADLRERANRFVRRCARPDSSLADLQQDAAALYRALFRSFEPRLASAQTWLVVPDDWIAGLPLGALVDAQGRYLVEQRTLVTLTSIAELAGHTLPVRWLASNLVIVAEPAATEIAGLRLPRLENVLAEVSAVAALSKSSRVLVGPEATAEAVQTILPTAAVFHFAGHGWSSGPSGALLLAKRTAGSEKLTARDIALLDLQKCRLAVLGACMTGTGEMKGPVDGASLVRSFLTAGARRVLASSWNVDDTATRRYMQRFYATLMREEQLAAAAATAAARSIKRIPDYEHPYFWAAFQLYGVP